MSNNNEIIYRYLSNKPDNPVPGDVYEDDNNVFSFIGKRWYLREDLDIESLRRNQRNEKIKDILDEK